jgi:hypothetical protein
MIYREAAHNRFKEHLEEARARCVGRGLMPYRAPLPPSSSLPTPEQEDQHLLDSFPPLVLPRGQFALLALLSVLGFFSLSFGLEAFLSRDYAFLLVGALFFASWSLFEVRRGARLVRGEVAWLKSLPFEVSGYLTSLRGDPSARDEYTIRVTVVMRDEPLPEWAIEAIPELTSRPLKVTVQQGELRFFLDGVTVKTKVSGKDKPPTNLPLRDWLHECVTQILLPIDTTYRIQRVEFFAR